MSHRIALPKVALVPTLLALTITMTADAATVSAFYTYDEIGRIRTARYDNGLCIAYHYDLNGNRTAQTITAGGSPVLPVWGTGVAGCFLWTAQ